MGRCRVKHDIGTQNTNCLDGNVPEPFGHTQEWFLHVASFPQATTRKPQRKPQKTASLECAGCVASVQAVAVK